MDIAQLTIGEMAKVEELAKAPLGHFGDEDKPQAKLYAALVFVLKRRENKDFSIDDAMNMTMDEMATFLGVDDDEDPKDEN